MGMKGKGRDGERGERNLALAHPAVSQTLVEQLSPHGLSIISLSYKTTASPGAAVLNLPNAATPQHSSSCYADPPTKKSFLLLLRNCNFATVINCNAVFSDDRPCERVIQPQAG